MKTCLLLCLLVLSSCSLATKLTKTGFNYSKVVQLNGVTYSVDRKYVWSESPSGLVRRYAVTDPKVADVIALSKGEKAVAVAVK